MKSIFAAKAAERTCYVLASLAFGLGLVGFLAAQYNSAEYAWTFILAGAYVAYNSWALGTNRRMSISGISLAPAPGRFGRAILLGLLWILYALLFWEYFFAS